jgi:hypothetical protein
MKYEVFIGHGSAAGANEEAKEQEVAPGVRLTEVVGPMKAIFATYSAAELARIDAVCTMKGIEVSEFSNVTPDGANLIKAELDKIVVTPAGEKVVSKAAIDQVGKLLWTYAV